MLSDLSSRIKRAKERLALTQEKEERFREQMAQQAAEAGTGINKVIITKNDYGELKSLKPKFIGSCVLKDSFYRKLMRKYFCSVKK